MILDSREKKRQDAGNNYINSIFNLKNKNIVCLIKSRIWIVEVRQYTPVEVARYTCQSADRKH
jgi:hypothetical protein